MASHQPKEDVFTRLTDPHRYTGAHRLRFDKEGRGRGLVGRLNIVDSRGHTSSAHRDATVRESPIVKKPVHLAPVRKFGVQAQKAKTITIFRNGDKHHKGVTFVVNNRWSFDQFKEKCTSLVRLPTGAVRHLYHADLLTRIRDVRDLHDNEHVLCTGPEPINLAQLPEHFKLLPAEDDDEEEALALQDQQEADAAAAAAAGDADDMHMHTSRASRYSTPLPSQQRSFSGIDSLSSGATSAYQGHDSSSAPYADGMEPVFIDSAAGRHRYSPQQPAAAPRSAWSDDAAYARY